MNFFYTRVSTIAQNDERQFDGFEIKTLCREIGMKVNLLGAEVLKQALLASSEKRGLEKEADKIKTIIQSNSRLNISTKTPNARTKRND